MPTPVNYTGLDTMFNNGMGNQAAFEIGQRNQLAQQIEAANLQEQLLQNQKAEQLNPLLVQYQQGLINEQDAKLPGLIGTSQVEAAKGKQATATLPMSIAAELSKLGTQIGAEGMAQMGQDAQKAAYAAQALRNVPVLARKQALGDLMTKYGADMNSPMISGIMNGDPESIPDRLDALGKGMALASQKYQEQAALEDIKGNYSVKGHEIAAGASRYTADQHLRAAMATASAHLRGVEAGMNIDKSIASLSAIPAAQRTQAQTEQLRTLIGYQLGKAAAGANALGAQVMAGQSPTAPQDAAQALAGKLAGGQQEPAEAALADAAKKAWGDYDPAKYQYRINPQTGNLERKAK